MTARARMIAGAVATIAGLALLLLATRSGRTRDISRHDLPYHIRAPSPRPQPTQPSQPPPGQQANKAGNSSLPGWVHIVAYVIGIGVAAAIVALAFIYLVRLLNRLDLHGRRRDKDDYDDAEMAPEDVARALAEAVDETLVTIERGETRDAIIACWLRLEDVAADAGVARRPAETAADLTERVLATLQVSAATLSRLADLYREARFSTHQLDASARIEARSALEQVRTELSRTAATQ